uniref:F-box associated domain-containing protein n=1 Tax=Panagrolaimus sp. JU765 TaxID=591449 RepID=A0AC34QKT5_9BILA
MLPPCDVIFQIFGAVPLISELKRFLEIWMEREKPIIFDEITFYFGTNQIETSWFEYYPKFNVQRKDSVNLFGEFIDYNCLRLTMKPNKPIFRCLNPLITGNPPFLFFQNGLPVEFISVSYQKIYFTVKCSTSQCFAVNICSTSPNELKIHPATFFLHRSQNLEINFNNLTIFTSPEQKIYIEFVESQNLDVAPIFLAPDFCPFVFTLPLQFAGDC